MFDSELFLVALQKFGSRSLGDFFFLPEPLVGGERGYIFAYIFITTTEETVLPEFIDAKVISLIFFSDIGLLLGNYRSSLGILHTMKHFVQY